VSEQSDAQTTKAVVERFYAAMGSWDEDDLRAILHDDAELHQPPTLPYGGIYHGAEEMLPLWKDIALHLADPTSFVMERVLVDGDRVTVVASSKGATTGKPMVATEEYTVRDGKVARIRMFWFDTTPVVEEANAISASRSAS
jgi:ketosteroid isomerase-like protein